MKTLAAGLLVLSLGTVAWAGVTNGTFDDGLNGWTVTGGAGLQSGNPFGLPTSPSGEPEAGVISSWGGDWNGPLGTISQIVIGVTGNQTLSGEIFAAAHSGDTWRNVKTEVLWNGAVVAEIARDADATLYAQDFPWTQFAVPVVATGNDTLEVKFTVHFAEWSWTAADNLQVTPEPAALGLLVLGLPLLRRRR
ncbi:MAG: hypothetical protein QUV05_05680 [Phycisphaerae bacterium]|nr:hypothetical protein [Phycisphaerae bacterium]